VRAGSDCALTRENAACQSAALTREGWLAQFSRVRAGSVLTREDGESDGESVLTREGGESVLTREGGESVLTREGGESVLTREGGESVLTREGGESVRMKVSAIIRYATTSYTPQDFPEVSLWDRRKYDSKT
jgi:hypothetical protein